MTSRRRPAAGPGPGVVKVRLSGAGPDIDAMASLLAAAGGLGLIDVSQPYPNRREAGARLYLTICLAPAAGQPTDREEP